MLLLCCAAAGSAAAPEHETVWHAAGAACLQIGDNSVIDVFFGDNVGVHKVDGVNYTGGQLHHGV